MCDGKSGYGSYIFVPNETINKTDANKIKRVAFLYDLSIHNCGKRTISFFADVNAYWMH